MPRDDEDLLARLKKLAEHYSCLVDDFTRECIGQLVDTSVIGV